MQLSHQIIILNTNVHEPSGLLLTMLVKMNKTNSIVVLVLIKMYTISVVFLTGNFFAFTNI